MNSEEKIIEIVAMVYRECDITDVPIDCQSVIEALGYDLIPYSCLSYGKRKACRKISEDAFTAGGAIYYNDDDPLYTRIRFSLMHELGHLLLQHTDSDMFREQEADTFASWMLAPRVDIGLCHGFSVAEVAGRYDISLAAARHVMSDYKRWLRRSKMHLFPSEEALVEQLSIKNKKCHDNTIDCFTKVMKHTAKKTEPQAIIIKLDAFKPKSRSLHGQLREISRQRRYLEGLSILYDLDLSELLLEQSRINYYYKDVI